MFQRSEFTMMWGFFHSCEHVVGLANLEKTHASLWGWFAYIISLMISSPLFSLFICFFLALLLVRNDTPWLYPLMVLFTFFLLSFALSFFLLSGRFPQHCLWTLLLVVFVCLFCYCSFDCQELVFFSLISPQKEKFCSYFLMQYFLLLV